MAISKKDAERAAAILSEMPGKPLVSVLNALLESKIKNKSFRKSVKRIRKALEPKKHGKKRTE
jgi:hypothetical protein